MSKFTVDLIGKSFDLELNKDGVKGFTVKVNGKDYSAIIEDISDSGIWISVGGSLYRVKLEGAPTSSKLDTLVNDRKRVVKSTDLFGSKKITLSKKSPQAVTQGNTIDEIVHTHMKTQGSEEGVMAPMPGKVVAVTVKVGDEVKVGDVVVILEAMKMENEITSEMDGKITEIKVKEGDSVDAHDVLVVVG